MRRVENEEADSAEELALIMFRTATLRSGFMLQESAEFADSVEKLMRKTLGIREDEQVEEEIIPIEDDATPEGQSDEDNQEEVENTHEEHEEL